MALDIVPNTGIVRFKTGLFYCRDQQTPAIYSALKKMRDAQPNLKLTSKYHNLTFKSDGVNDEYGKLLQIALMGDTNRHVSFMGSPFTFRWAVHKLRQGLTAAQKKRLESLDSGDIDAVRKAFNFADWFYKAMVLADTEGVSLEADVFKAWGIASDKTIGIYSMHGLIGLRRVWKNDYGNIYFSTFNYEEMWPPLTVSPHRKT
jgi:hypothetical protein